MALIVFGIGFGLFSGLGLVLCLGLSLVLSLGLVLDHGLGLSVGLGVVFGLGFLPTPFSLFSSSSMCGLFCLKEFFSLVKLLSGRVGIEARNSKRSENNSINPPGSKFETECLNYSTRRGSKSETPRNKF